MTESVESAGVTFTSQMDVSLIDYAGGDRSHVRAARVSTLTDDRDDEDAELSRKDAALIRFLLTNRHGSPFEHNSMTFRVQAPIAVFREWHRHRIGFSYNEQSGRYVDMPLIFYVPPPERGLVQVGKPGEYSYEVGDDGQHQDTAEEIRRTCEVAAASYLRLRADGVAREVARGVLPVYTFSKMYVTCNARSMMAFLSLRTYGGGDRGEPRFPSFPMWEIAACADLLEDFFEELFPVTHQAFCEHGRVAP